MPKRKKRSGGTLNTVTSCISTTMVLILLGTVVLFVTMAVNFSRAVSENFTVEVMLDDSISTEALAQLKADIMVQPYTKQVNYISKEEGTRELMKDLGASPEEFLGGSPIPAEYEVFLNAEYANKDSLARYMPILRGHEDVKEVVYPLEVIDMTNRTISVISGVLLVVAVLLACVSFSLINNTVRMGIYAQRFSIQTMKLVGAKWSFIRRPFMVKAFWIGLTSAVIAGGLLLGGMQALVRLNGNSEFEVVTPMVMAVTLGTVFVAGLLLTLLCTFFSVNRHLRMSNDDVYMK
ncbi:MAG: permease-like cell division protein FtsX [Bacteroidales bacterium]|nr:permease-like cell division protein FtsX [Bacteroidales bacterium]